MDRNIQLLGIAKKAGLLAVGGDDVSAAARNGKAWLIISASDASGGTLRRARINAEQGNSLCVTVPYSKIELGSVTRRGSPATVAFLDVGLAAGFMKGLAETEPQRYSDAADFLAEKARALAKRKKHTPSGKMRTAQ